MYTLHPYTKEALKKQMPSIDFSKMTYHEKQKELSDSFGGRKSRLKLKNKEQTKVCTLF